VALILAEPVAYPDPCGSMFTVGNDGVENVLVDSSMQFDVAK
jgi:hypothetical protein